MDSKYKVLSLVNDLEGSQGIAIKYKENIIIIVDTLIENKYEFEMILVDELLRSNEVMILI